jgi:hypothetical protein
MEASAAGLTPVAPDVPAQPVEPSLTIAKQLQAQIAALQQAHEAANPTAPAKTDLITRFKELAEAGVHIADRLRVLADEGYGKQSTVECVAHELLDEIAKVVL